MKVYYKPPQTGIYGFSEATRFFTNLLYEKWKYQIMWELRGLEDQLKKEKGMIVIEYVDKKKPAVRLSGFSKTMERKIRDTLAGLIGARKIKTAA